MYTYTLHEWFWTSCSLTPCLIPAHGFMFYRFTWCRVLRVSRVARIVRILRALPELLILVKVGPLDIPWTWHSHGAMGCSNRPNRSGLGGLFYLTQICWDKLVVPLKMSECGSAHAESWVPFPFGIHKIDSRGIQSREATQLNKHDIFLWACRKGWRCALHLLNWQALGVATRSVFFTFCGELRGLLRAGIRKTAETRKKRRSNCCDIQKGQKSGFDLTSFFDILE